MVNSRVFQIIEKAYSKEFAEKILQSYTEVESNYFLEKWKPSELDAGHFVEAVRRIIELELTGASTSFSQQLSNFTDQVLNYYEKQSGNESFRILIPRVLKSVYNIRNKRGAGHIKDISPNEMDSTLILYSVKWVLSEIVRLKSNLSIPDTQRLMDEIVERKVDLIWKGKDFKRILEVGISARDQILILLFDSSPQNIEELRTTIEYRHRSNFKILVKKMHRDDRLLEYKQDGQCLISPKGVLAAEEIIKKHKSQN